MNISQEVWAEAQKRGLDWVCTGGGCDYIHRLIKTEHYNCELTLSRHGESPKKLDEECEVGVALHTSGYLSIGMTFNNVLDALDFMQKTKGIFFLPDMYECGKKELAGQYGGLRGS